MSPFEREREREREGRGLRKWKMNNDNRTTERDKDDNNNEKWRGESDLGGKDGKRREISLELKRGSERRRKKFLKE